MNTIRLLCIVLLYQNISYSYTTAIVTSVTAKDERDPMLERLKNKIKCADKVNGFNYFQHGNYYVLENYITPISLPNRCYETITYTTHCDLNYLHNLVPVLERWNAPVSVAVYSPGSDFEAALNTVFYMRNCENSANLIKNYVTFHFYFEASHRPSKILVNSEDAEKAFECNQQSDLLTASETAQTYRKLHGLTYPINVGRNIARKAATTYLVFPSDIELYPNPGFVEDFLNFYNKFGNPGSREVFVLPVFEILKSAVIPKTKTELVQMIHNKIAFPFHAKLCLGCHLIPKYKEWLEAPFEQDLKIFTTTKRSNSLNSWEPPYVGTQLEPEFSEDLTWEGQSDKQIQTYAMCLLDYDFHVLNNGFLVHKPGIKVRGEMQRPKHTEQTLLKVKEKIIPKLEKKYGRREGCFANGLTVTFQERRNRRFKAIDFWNHCIKAKSLEHCRIASSCIDLS